MSCYGNPWLKTPHLDSLYADGVRLEDYHVDPVCTPTRAALMTGRHSLRVGAWAVTEGRQLLNPDEVTMAQVFKQSGYRTGMFGKWHLGDTYPYAPQYRGFDDVVCHKAGGVGEIGNPTGNDYFDDSYFRNGVQEKFDGYCTDIFFRETLRFIDENKDQPFFVYLPLNAMHGPFTVAENYWKRFSEMGMPETRSKFYGMVENFDETLGILLASLKEQQLEENTVVIFMGDNGSGGGVRPIDGHPGFSGGMRGWKGSTYEGGHRVACFVRWPGHFDSGRTVENLTKHHDWLPTLIEVCGLEAPKHVKFDGQSIVPLLAGKSSDWPDRTFFVARHADQPVPFSAELKQQTYPTRAILTERWRLVDDELYEIQKDPGQKNDVAREHPEVMTRLESAYSEWWSDVMSHEARFTPFFVGASEQNPTKFTVRDWHPTEGGVIWKMELVEDDDLFVNGFWSLDVVQDGSYEVRLSRYPEDAEQPMGADKAVMEIGDSLMSSGVFPDEASVTFNVDLKKGPTLLKTRLRDAKSKKERGAYYISITKI